MKKKFKIRYSAIIFTLICLVSILFIGFMIKANILPLKLFLLGILVLSIFLAVIWFLLFFKRKKKNKKRDIIAYIISGILVFGLVFIFFYLNSTLNFFSGFGNNKYKEENYVVVVLKDSNYNEVKDLKDKDIAYVPSELNKINDALNKLDEEVKINNIKYEQYDTMFEDLINKKIDSLLVEDSYLKLLEENSDYLNHIKIIYTITISTEISTESKNVDVNKNTFTIYISGIDTYGKIASVSRSDVNIVATINPTTKQVLLLSIPRDYYVQLHGTTGYKDKLTHAGLYGIDTSISTIEDLVKTDINYYYRVNFSTLEKVVDAIGGVDVYSAYTFNSSVESGGTYHFTKGYNHMNGNQALAFSRERHALPGGDRARGENQKAVIDGVIRRATSSAIITKYNSLLNSLKGIFQTNMSDDDILKLIKMQLNDMAKWNITSYSLDGSDASEYTYSYQHQKLYVMKPKQETLDEAISLIDKVINGDKLDSSYSSNATDVKNPTKVTISEPSKPIVSETPAEPSTPIVPETPAEPSTPTEPETPSKPTEDPVDIGTGKPTIELYGDKSITIEQNGEYNELGANAKDATNNSLDVVITGKVYTSEIGKYIITYTATDALNETVSVTRTVNVIQASEEND